MFFLAKTVLSDINLICLGVNFMPPGSNFLPFIKIEKHFFTAQNRLKYNTGKGLRQNKVQYHCQLLKNKWYYVLHSTKTFISLCRKGERKGKFPKSAALKV